MNKEELKGLYEKVKSLLGLARYELDQQPDPEVVGDFENELFKYFIEKDIDTIYVLYTPAIFPYTNEKALNISFSNRESYELFMKLWGRNISDISGLLFLNKQSSITHGSKDLSISLLLYGRSLTNFCELLEDELDLEIVNC